MKRVRLSLLLLLFGFLSFCPIVAKAWDSRTGEVINVAKDQTVNGNLYFSGQSITIDGHVVGDVIGIGQTIQVNGQVDGDVIVLGQDINCNGAIGGSLRAGANTLTVNGLISRNLTVFASGVVIGENSNIGWDAVIASAWADVKGKINGYLNGNFSKLTLDGQIGKDAIVVINNQEEANPLIIGDQAKISGKLTYTSKNQLQNNKEKIVGEIIHNIPGVNKKSAAKIIWNILYSIFAALLIGLVVINFWKKPIAELSALIRKQPLKAMGRGIILMFIPPLVALVLVMIVIGLPLGLMLVGLWFASLYLAKIISGLALGRFIFKKILKKEKTSKTLEMAAGIAILWLLFAIPYLGKALAVFSIWLGLGGIWLFIASKNKKK